jgi:murein DD-endopeptidase MepM/ murein hydrolase activator NlpD
MSSRAGLHPLHGYGHRPPPAPDRPRARLQAAAPADYTLTHAGRQVRIGPVAFWVVVGTLVIMALWSAATATYFAFHDDVLTRLIARQADMQFAYEDRIADLRAQVDRITSRQMLDQEKVEQNLGDILKRQATLENRAGAISAIADPATTGSIRPTGRTPAAAAPASNINPKPSPISDTVIFTAPPDREARLESRTPPPATFRLASTSAAKPPAGNMVGALGRLQTSLDRVEARQAAALNEIEEQVDGKAQRMRTVLADLGLDLSKIPTGPVGGPFIAAKPPAAASGFDRQVYRVAVARAQIERFNRALVYVPVRKPIPGELDVSSGFGVRYDPFIRTPAMHTGLDFRGETGEPVRVTANGTVTHAAWQGGYGKMIEVDHGHGFATRYGHLSAIDVKVGQSVKIGQTIGRLGSTGRSTGPHLHYETRVDGDAVDPQKFLRAGIRLGNPS